MTRINRYVEAALQGEASAVLGAAKGSRGATVYRAACSIGSLVGAGLVEESAAEEALVNAALASGMAARRARSNVLRGIKRGRENPRDLPDGLPVDGRQSAARVALKQPPRTPNYPPQAEVAALWESARPVTEDAEVSDWLESRGLEPAAVEMWDLTRAFSRHADQPDWANLGGRSWSHRGFRALFRLWDHSGAAVTLRARPTVKQADAPKTVMPVGFDGWGAVLADPLAVQLLQGEPPEWWQPREIVVLEGEMDFLTWASRQSDSCEQGPACFGLSAGGWTHEIAAQIPDGAKVAIRTHLDDAGRRYAKKVAAGLRGRCDVRWLKSEGVE